MLRCKKLLWICLMVSFLTIPGFGEMKNSVRTDSGTVSGVAGRDAAITVFEGIPYAAPPVGELRWTAPHAPKKWDGVLKADHFGNGCAQDFPQASFPKSEDCLYLNVWTPAQSSNEKLPVMVWIHGGGLRVGSSSESLYDGEELARKGVVVISLNYRLGVFGFLAHPELTKESPNHASGNYGLLDQLAALQWVHRNVAAFGGDPEQVTIFGQSAGGFSVFAQVATPLSTGLFRAAIAESGGARMGFGGTGMPSLEDGEKGGVKFAESVGAHSLAELRAMPAEKLMNAGGPAGPIVDGWFFPQSPGTIFDQGKQNKVTMILGSNSDEAQHMIRTALPGGEFRERAEKRFGGDASKYLAIYPGDSDQSARISQQQEMADRTAASQVELANGIARSGMTAYLYYFGFLDTGGYNSENPTLGLKIGADHGAELPYVFGLMNHWKAAVPKRDVDMQNVMMPYWINFAKTLNPNGEGLPVWKPYSTSSNEVMVLDERVGMMRHPRASQLEFIQSHPAN